MRLLRKNLRTVWFAPYEGKHPVEATDEYGNTYYTGEYAVRYGRKTPCEAHVAAVYGAIADNLFGGAVNYDRIITLANARLPIDEYSVMWIDVPPSEDYDYVVKRVARDLNTTVVALSKVNVDE